MKSLVDVIILFLTAFVLAAVFAFLLFGGDQFSLAGKTLCTFLLVLTVAHIWCYLRHSSHEQSFIRIVDYVYLSVAAIGVIGTAWDIDARSASQQMLMQSASLKENLDLMRSMLSDLNKERCETNKEQLWCDAIIIFQKGITDTENFSYPDAHTPREVRWHNAIVHTAPVIGDGLEQLGAPEVNVLFFKSVTGASSISLKYWVRARDNAVNQWQGMNAFFYNLLAAALALRITRVSVELGEWFARPGSSVPSADVVVAGDAAVLERDQRI